ncbi:S-adenosyl-L-methionine dependent methyltransferase, partial [Desarmillaria tabescens]
MHDRNIYRRATDFVELAKAYPDLENQISEVEKTSHISSSVTNLTRPRCLTKALLYRDFGVDVVLPEDRLCPPVLIGRRLNYVLWIQDIMREHPSSSVCGVDIGTGASAIYPLLACKLELDWSFVATGESKLDDASFQLADSNIARNHLGHRIRVLQAHPDQPILFPLKTYPDESFSFTMCNPPFYASLDEVMLSAEGKAMDPNAVCTGAPIEMVTSGGEASFVCQMVRESKQLGARCRWYTSMLGKMSSLKEVVELLRELSIENYAITEFVQGQTRRWAIGWSFTDERLPDSMSRIPNLALRSLMPPHNTIQQSVPEDKVVDIHDVLLAISGLETELCDEYVLVRAKEDTWSRSARRKRKRDVVPLPLACKMVCTIKVFTGGVEFQWVRGAGLERGLFDSFCSHVCRKI